MEVSKPYNITYKSAHEFSEMEGLAKCCRNDVIVTIGEKKCYLYVTDMEKLKVDFLWRI